ncbi:DHS-like NAD/FAD-binding domain-containing protein [Mycena polygramma]|nr:DHS-like NAD/FAD-binding domain-containing protein [Mycena polygramma]
MNAPLHVALTSTPTIDTDTATLNTILLDIMHAQNIIIVCGAGVSEFAGIPTFSSKTSHSFGIRSTKSASLKDLFDISALKTPESTSMLMEVIEKLHARSMTAEPTPFHKLLHTLDARGQVLRVYTQNIDALEKKAGLSSGLPILEESLDDTEEEHLVISPTTRIATCIPLHGSCDAMHCDICRQSFPVQNCLSSDKPYHLPPCPSCRARSDDRIARGQRALGIPKLRPSIVLYNEEHPDSQAITAVIRHDLNELDSHAAHQPSILLVTGTSLQIPGTTALVKEFASLLRSSTQNRTILVNLTFPSGQPWKEIFDVWIEGDIQELSRRMGTKLSTVPHSIYYTVNIYRLTNIRSSGGRVGIH